jgi:tetratricopeptide (TPR) repeat protein
VTDPSAEPRFLAPDGELAWVRLRRHLDRADRFWIAFVLTSDALTADVLRERIEGNRRLRAEPFVLLRPRDPQAFTHLAESFESQAAIPCGCTMVLPPLTATPEWITAWRSLLYLLNHRRDVFRRTLGGLILVAPPAVKPIAQREASDLWSVLDLLIELAPPRSGQPVAAEPTRVDEGRSRIGDPGVSVGGLSIGEPTDAMADEAAALLALPSEQLATTARARATDAIQAARSAGQYQLAAVLLLAQADGYRQTGDPAAALNLLRNALRLDGVDDSTRIRLLNAAADLALLTAELVEAATYAEQSVALEEQRAAADPATPEALRNLSVSLNRLGDIDRARGDLDAAYARYSRSLDLAERLAAQLATPEALRDLSVSLILLGDIDRARGDLDVAYARFSRGLDLRERLAAQLATPEALRDLSLSLHRLGDIDQDRGDLDAAYARYGRGLDLAERLAAQLATPEALRGLSISLNQLGDIDRARGDLEAASTRYSRSLDLAERLAAQLATPQALRGLLLSLERLAAVERDRGNAQRADALQQRAADVDASLDRPTDTP